MLLYNILYCPSNHPKGRSHFSSCKLWVQGWELSAEILLCVVWATREETVWWVDTDLGSVWCDDSVIPLSRRCSLLWSSLYLLSFVFSHISSSFQDKISAILIRLQYQVNEDLVNQEILSLFPSSPIPVMFLEK